ncbi:MAG: cold shock and DUF1294 domain-containing protein [Chthoniobacteraceae bacterium]
MNSVRQSGTIVKWDDEKGFGFIAPDAGSGDVFAHVKAVVGARRPAVGDRVFYFPGKDSEGRARAAQVQFEDASGVWSWRVLALVLSAAFLAAQGLAAWLGRITPVIPVVYAMMSAVTLGAYSHDKASARHGAWRLPENVLHMLELFGGWPGALVAQQWLRHKTRKLSYQLLFWAIVAAHIGLWTWLATGK